MAFYRTSNMEVAGIVIRTEEYDGETYYCARDICSVLDIKNVTAAVRNIASAEKTIISIVVFGNNMSQKRKMHFLSLNGLKHLIFKTRSINAHKLAHVCNIEMDTKYESKEASSLQVIEKAFSGEYMIFQHIVGKYRIDMYFPEYNLAIECDENDHNDRDQLYEKYRQKYLTKRLKCEFIRYNPDADDFDVMDVVNQVFQHIKKCVQNV